MPIPIILAIGMHNRLTTLVEVGFSNADYDSKRRLRKGCTSANWGNDREIKKAIALEDNKDDDKENL